MKYKITITMYIYKVIVANIEFFHNFTLANVGGFWG